MQRGLVLTLQGSCNHSSRHLLSLLGTLHVPFLLVLFPWASLMGLDPLFPFAGRKDGGCWSVLDPFSRASRSNLKLTSLTNTSLRTSKLGHLLRVGWRNLFSRKTLDWGKKGGNYCGQPTRSSVGNENLSGNWRSREVFFALNKK